MATVRGRSWLAAAGTLAVLLVLGAVLANQVKVHRGRQARAAAAEQRQALFDMLQPVGFANCDLQRFGEPHDGGYLMCGNLLDGVEGGYSYGIAGYDGWGCDVSTRAGVTVHQYDCFDTTQPACDSGRTIFHAECVGDRAEVRDGRIFDTIESQLARNGDRSKRVVLKIDVEGAEWDAFLAAPDAVLQQIDQLAVEFHGVDEAKYLRAVERLRGFFEVAHLHFNNASCVEGLDPFPSWAYEALFVNRRLAVLDPSRAPRGGHALDAPNDPTVPDCQPMRP